MLACGMKSLRHGPRDETQTSVFQRSVPESQRWLFWSSNLATCFQPLSFIVVGLVVARTASRCLRTRVTAPKRRRTTRRPSSRHRFKSTRLISHSTISVSHSTPTPIGQLKPRCHPCTLPPTLTFHQQRQSAQDEHQHPSSRFKRKQGR